MKEKQRLEKSGIQQCQKCLKYGHWTFECKNTRTYLYRPSRSTINKNPKLKDENTVESGPSRYESHDGDTYRTTNPANKIIENQEKENIVEAIIEVKPKAKEIIPIKEEKKMTLLASEILESSDSDLSNESSVSDDSEIEEIVPNKKHIYLFFK